MKNLPGKKLHSAFLLFIFTLVISIASQGCRDIADKGGQLPAESVFLSMEEDVSGFARALEPCAVKFPRDRGAHDDYQTEWWYYTGNLTSDEGRRFGFQLTFFRRALTPSQALPDRIDGRSKPSAWRTNQVYMAHFAISDIDGGHFYHSETFGRGALGLAGAQAQPYRVWLNDWYAREIAPGIVALYAATDDMAIDLVLEETLPPVLHGDCGLSAKGPETGNASYYYSIIRQETRGSVTVKGDVHDVSGLSWKDHEYSTSALGTGTIGWDWFSLQFDDGTAVMFFQIRRDDGTLSAASSGTFIHADGSTQHLSREDWDLFVSDTWTSPDSGADYPVEWSLRIEPIDLVLGGKALMSKQELTVSPIYWEGAVVFNGTRAGRPVSAQGYVEMTGYAESMEGRF